MHSAVYACSTVPSYHGTFVDFSYGNLADNHQMRDSDYVYWKFYWRGFEATGHVLQRNGWKFSSIRSERTFSDTLVIELPGVATFCSGYIMDYVRKDVSKAYDFGMSINLRHVAQDFILNVHGEISTVPLDMTPISALEYRRVRYSEQSPFKRLIVPNEQQRIILPPEPSIDEVLDKIIKMQQPGQVEYFNKKVKENKMPEATLSAQIIQLREAA